MKGLPDHPNETFKRLNPEFYGKSVAERIRTSIPEPNLRRESQDRGVGKIQEGFRYSITFTVYRKRKLDGFENSPFALKALKDCVSNYLGFSNDEDPRLSWVCYQIKSESTQGTHVLIQRS